VFRAELPSLPEPLVDRPRLVELLARRWERRLVTVVAGAGFGKTALLAAAMAAAAGDPGRRDVWLGCEPADEDADHLAAGLADALGLRPGVGVEALCEAVWTRAPEQVCVLLDDAHEIPAGSPGAALLEQLVARLPTNGHVVLASRDNIPVPAARWAASGQLVRVREEDLVFQPAELKLFAAARGVDPELLSSTGGWPALAELVAGAGADLVIDYLWEEVLGRIGTERAALLASFAAAGGGDDDVVTALAGRPLGVDELVTSVPLVMTNPAGWAQLHPLWGPALRRVLPETDANRARRQAAAVHRWQGRLSLAVDLLVEAEAWDELLGLLADATTHLIGVPPAELGRWHRLLPVEHAEEPAALRAAGVGQLGHDPLGAARVFAAAAVASRAAGDVDGEVAALAQEGLVRWWANDRDALLALHVRVVELAELGSDAARTLDAVGRAAMAHLAGDSAQVRAALADVTGGLPPGWYVVVHWLRSVAHRRDGDVRRAAGELAEAATLPAGSYASVLESAALHTAWLEGHVDDARARWADLRDQLTATGNDYLVREATLELAYKTAWLGEADLARRLLQAAGPLVADMEGPLPRILRALTAATLAAGDGDEPAAAALLAEHVCADLDSAHAWYWRDRTALALTHVLVPESRPLWARQPLGAAHQPGLALAEALGAARRGDLETLAIFEWPPTGIIRSHLPWRWIVELAAAGTAADNPPPTDLLDALGARLRPTVLDLADTATTTLLATAAKQWAAQLPDVPPYRVRINVLGPLQVLRNGEPVTSPELRRQRVRELLGYLVAHRRARRETIAAEQWPDLDDGGRNLRVTLNYTQRLLQPDRADAPPYFLRTEGHWLALTPRDQLAIDAWELEDHLDHADTAERAGEPLVALEHYRAALGLWRGEPYADIPYATWALHEQTRLRARYTTAAVRAGELLLAAAQPTDARDAAAHATTADPYDEAAYGLLIRAHLAAGNRSAARLALDACRTALAELDLQPSPETVDLLTTPAR
jgi:LuxR family transcriptional regulator, maltose regulon positive regulatory protein